MKDFPITNIFLFPVITETSKAILKKTIEVSPSFLLLILIAFVFLKILDKFFQKLKPLMLSRIAVGPRTNLKESEKRIDTILSVFVSIIKLIVWLIVLLFLLRRLGINIAPILAGAGILGLTIGFGAQEIVRDFISGFFMLLENHIRQGDVAIVNGTGGLVEHIGLRTIILRDLSGVVHIFQNGKINSLANMTKEWSAVVFNIGVAYKENTDKVCSIIERVSKELSSDPSFSALFLEPMEIFGVDEFKESAVNIKCRIKTLPGQQWTIGREYNRRIKIAFDLEKIEIPFPHRTLYWGEGASKFTPKKDW